MNLQEVDNFFPILVQKNIISQVLDSSFIWGYTYSINSLDDNLVKKWLGNANFVDDYAFVHPVIPDDPINEKLLNLVKVYTMKHFGKKINEILRARFIFSPANPNANTDNILMPHIDLTFPHQTLLYYVNSNDAETVFFDDSYKAELENYILPTTFSHAIKPKQGKAVLFDGSTYHAGKISRQDKRILLSLNFI